jgi:hypothetical protein
MRRLSPVSCSPSCGVTKLGENPAAGQAKVGDLAGIRVHKFRFNRQEYLIAYRPPTAGQLAEGIDIELLLIDFYQVGAHENFYDALKKYLKAERNA